MAQTTCLTSFGSIVSFFLSFVCDLLLLIFTGYKLHTTQQGVRWEVETTRWKSERQGNDGPNDVSDVDWANRKFFLSFVCDLLLLTNIYRL